MLNLFKTRKSTLHKEKQCALPSPSQQGQFAINCLSGDAVRRKAVF